MSVHLSTRDTLNEHSLSRQCELAVISLILEFEQFVCNERERKKGEDKSRETGISMVDRLFEGEDFCERREQIRCIVEIRTKHALLAVNYKRRLKQDEGLGALSRALRGPDDRRNFV